MPKNKLLLLNNIQKPDYVKKFKRLGRGAGDHGNKCGRGSDGQKARTGHKIKNEGGQFKSYLRINKRGFHRDKKEIFILKLNSVLKISEFIKNKNIKLEDIINFCKLKPLSKIKILNDDTSNLNDIIVESHFASKSVMSKIGVILIK